MKSSSNRHEQAAFWFLRLREPNVALEEIDEAMAWLAESPENQAAFDTVEKVWSIEGGAVIRSRQGANPALRRLNISSRKWSTARPLSVAATVLVMMAVAATVTTAHFWESPPA